jgi:hypothetical protein
LPATIGAFQERPGEHSLSDDRIKTQVLKLHKYVELGRLLWGFSLASRAPSNRLKDFRRVATRYDRLARNYLASVCLAAALVWFF